MGSKTFYITLGLIGAVLIIGLHFLFLTNKNAPLPKTPEPSQAPISTNSGSTSQTQVKEVEVSATEFSYSPSSLTFNKGDTVRLTFKNDGTVSHNLTIRGLNIETKTISPGQSDTIEFTLDKTGSYTFFCSVDSHEELGLKGDLEVR